MNGQPSVEQTVRTADNRLEYVASSELAEEVAYFLNEERIHDAYTVAGTDHWEIADGAGTAGGTFTQTREWSPPGHNPTITASSNSYAISATESRDFIQDYAYGSPSWADLRAGLVVLAAWGELTVESTTWVTAGPSDSIETMSTGIFTSDLYYKTSVVRDGVVQVEWEDRHRIIDVEWKDQPETYPVSPSGSYSWPMAETGCHNDVTQTTHYNFTSASGHSLTWGAFAHLDVLASARLGSQEVFAIRKAVNPDVPDSVVGELYLQVSDMAYPGIFVAPDPSAIQRLGVRVF